MRTVAASVADDKLIAESSEAEAAVNTCRTVNGCPYTITGFDASVSGMPLQKSDATCNSANPRTRYISAMFDDGVGAYVLSAAMA